MEHELHLPLNSLFFLIEQQNWDEIPKAMDLFPGMAEERFEIQGFYNDSPTASTKVSALQYACKFGSSVPEKIIKCLYKSNPKQIYTKDSLYKRTALHIACMNQISYGPLRLLLKYNENAACQKDALGRLPLHYACRDPNADMKSFELLLKANLAAVNVSDTSGFLPIHVACRSNAPFQVIKKLVKIDPTTLLAKTKKGSTVTTCAKLGKCDPQCIEWLNKKLNELL